MNQGDVKTVQLSPRSVYLFSIHQISSGNIGSSVKIGIIATGDSESNTSMIYNIYSQGSIVRLTIKGLILTVNADYWISCAMQRI